MAVLAPPPTRLRRLDRRRDLYWIARCEGYSVVSRNGRVGTVFGVEFEPETGVVEALRIRTGLLRQHIAEIGTDEVISIEPRRRRVYVRWEDER